MKILECSTHGDKRFSALYAKVSVYGVYDTIEIIIKNVRKMSLETLLKKVADLII